jgi:microcystin degradation protein MlrC
MRVGIISLAHESNTFATTPTTFTDFEQLLLLTGPAFGAGFSWKHHEVSGFLDTLRELGIEAVPMFMANAPPSGTIEKATLRKLLDRLFAEVEQAGKVDGYLVAPHGAAVSEEITDVDGHWLTELRKRAGADTPIIGTLDPHANLTPAMVSACNALVAYSTNPHIDQYQAGAKAAELMGKTLRGEVRPVTAAAYPPIAINIERQFTAAEPCLSLYAYGKKTSQEPGVLSTSVILGFPYADVPEMGSALLVVTDNDRQQAQQLADDWAAELYRRRAEFVGELIDIDQAIEKALAAPSPVCLLDMGDNVGGGGPADATIVVEAFTAEVSVLSLHEGRFTEPKARHGAKSVHDMGKTALVSTASGITIMLTSKRTFPVSMVQLTSCGLDPGAFRILVAKGVHAPVAGYAEVSKTFIRVNTPGVTTADMGKFTFHRRRQPLFPFENV